MEGMKKYKPENPWMEEIELSDYDIIMVEALNEEIDFCQWKATEEQCEEYADKLESMPLGDRLKLYEQIKEKMTYNFTFGKFQDSINGMVHFFRNCGGFTCVE